MNILCIQIDRCKKEGIDVITCTVIFLGDVAGGNSRGASGVEFKGRRGTAEHSYGRSREK